MIANYYFKRKNHPLHRNGLSISDDFPSTFRFAFLLVAFSPDYRLKDISLNQKNQPTTINYQLSTINYQLSTINYQPSTVNYQPSTVNRQLSTVNCQPSTVNRQLSTVNCQPSTVNRQLSTNHLFKIRKGLAVFDFQ
ncbi:hypothetical protein [Myroides fluvii]|uniref:hypothetical protein n=1 Tax=Myroides fluvii TaxID=2572594 RepID=UPI0018EEDCD3|nr:hypothetical protein [Myroides fluvii]